MRRVAVCFLFLFMLVVPFQMNAQAAAPDGLYIVVEKQGVYYSFDDLFDPHIVEEVIALINLAELKNVYVLLDGRIVDLMSFAFENDEGVPATVETMPPVPFVDRFGNAVTFSWDESLEIVDVQ